MRQNTRYAAALALLTSFALVGFLWGDKAKDEAKSASQAKNEASQAAKPAEGAASAAAEAAESGPMIGEDVQIGNETGKLVYKFETEDQLKAFAQLWQQRRGIVTRLAVLQSYLSEEQARIAELNEQFSEEYQVDVSKKFVLDSDKGFLVELPQPEPAAEAAPSEDTAAADTQE